MDVSPTEVRAPDDLAFEAFYRAQADRVYRALAITLGDPQRGLVPPAGAGGAHVHQGGDAAAGDRAGTREMTRRALTVAAPQASRPGER